MYHVLYNNHKIFKKPKLYILEQIYTWFSLIYAKSKFQTTLEDYLAFSESNDPNQNINIYFKNIHLLFTYFLPLVSLFIF